jgi:DNA-binding transcriptional regulator YiaG
MLGITQSGGRVRPVLEDAFETNDRKEQAMSARRGATVQRMTASTATSIGTIALADQLNHLRERVPLSEHDVAAATGADEATVRGWLERRDAPAGQPAMRLSELIAACERLEISTKPEAIPDWLNRPVPMLGGHTPLESIATGGYERVAAIAEDFIYPSFT